MMQKNLLICASSYESAIHLMHAGVHLKHPEYGEIHLLHIQKQALNDYVAEIEKLYQLASAYRAECHVIQSDHPIGEIARFVSNHNIHVVLLGESRHRIQRESFFYKLQSSISNRTIPILIAQDESHFVIA